MQRMTKQKKILYDEIKQFKSFFNAYKLHTVIAKKHKKFGLATIYRWLNKLEKEGNIHSFVCGSKKIYSISKTNHVHFKCEKCRKIIHINIRNIDFIKELTNYDVCHFQIELTGTCSGCRK